MDENIIYDEASELEEKFFWGNPRIEIKEGFIRHKLYKFGVNNKNENAYDENDLEIVKQYIWEINKNNKLLQSKDLLCTNVPNKISISEYLNIISIYLSYIESIKVLKSCIPNKYYIYLSFKNIEYANVFFNTFNYSSLNFIEKEFLIYSEVIRIDFGSIDEYNKACNENPKIISEGYQNNLSESNLEIKEDLKKINIKNIVDAYLNQKNKMDLKNDIKISETKQAFLEKFENQNTNSLKRLEFKEKDEMLGEYIINKRGNFYTLSL